MTKVITNCSTTNSNELESSTIINNNKKRKIQEENGDTYNYVNKKRFVSGVFSKELNNRSNVSIIDYISKSYIETAILDCEFDKTDFLQAVDYFTKKCEYLSKRASKISEDLYDKDTLEISSIPDERPEDEVLVMNYEKYGKSKSKPEISIRDSKMNYFRDSIQGSQSIIQKSPLPYRKYKNASDINEYASENSKYNPIFTSNPDLQAKSLKHGSFQASPNTLNQNIKLEENSKSTIIPDSGNESMSVFEPRPSSLAYTRSNSKAIKAKRKFLRSFSFLNSKSSIENLASPSTFYTDHVSYDSSNTSSLSSNSERSYFDHSTPKAHCSQVTPRRLPQLFGERKKKARSCILPSPSSPVSSNSPEPLSRRWESASKFFSFPKKRALSQTDVCYKKERENSCPDRRRSVRSCIFPDTIGEDYTPYGPPVSQIKTLQSERKEDKERSRDELDLDPENSFGATVRRATSNVKKELRRTLRSWSFSPSSSNLHNDTLMPLEEFKGSQEELIKDSLLDISYSPMSLNKRPVSIPFPSKIKPNLVPRR